MLLVLLMFLLVPEEISFECSILLKELIVMSGSGLKPGGQRIQAQERILVDEISLDVIVVNLSSDDRVEEGSLSSCKLSSDDRLSSSSKLFMRLFICLRNSSTGSPSTGTGKVGLDLGYQFICVIQSICQGYTFVANLRLRLGIWGAADIHISALPRLLWRPRGALYL